MTRRTNRWALVGLLSLVAGAMEVARGTADDLPAGPTLRLRALDPGTGERFALTIAWEAWPAGSDPLRRCRQAALYLGGEIARRMTVESVHCAGSSE
jgi:hypothetical protein